MSQKLNTWKAANEVFKSLAHLSVEEAQNHLQSMDIKDIAVKEIVAQLLQSSLHTDEFVTHKLINFPNTNKDTDGQVTEGQQLDQYELIKEIGCGGMARVFLARRIRTDNQKPVAIKVFNTHNSTELLKHFIAEQQILANLSHPNIVSMHHGGTSDAGDSFLVMELIENASDIDHYVKQHAMGKYTIIEMIVKAASAIAYAHGQLVIHRDIKPSNILIDQQGEVKVVDFGIAKLIDQVPANNPLQTIMALTPTYASPEQINQQSISVQTDIYSLALVTIKLITGKTPLATNRTINACSQDEHHLEQILKQSMFDKDLKNVLKKATRTDPIQRYKSMQQFADDLVAWQKQEPVSATPDTLVYQVKKFAHRRTALFATLVTLFITLSIGMLLLSWQYNKIKVEALKAQQVKNFMLDSFESTDPDITQGESISANQLLETAALKLNSDLAMDQQIKFELLQTIGIAYSKLGDLAVSLKHINQSLDIRPNNSKSLSHKVLLLFELSRFDELTRLVDSIEIANLPQADQDRIYRTKAKLLSRKAEFPAAIELMESLRQNHQGTELDHVLNQQLLAELYFYQSNPQRSIEIIELLLAQPQINHNHMAVMDINRDLAEYYIELGDYEHALATLEKLVKSQQRVLGSQHPILAKTLKLLGSSYMHVGDFEKAKNRLQQSFKMNQKIYGENSLQSGYDLNTLAIISHQEGQLQKAIDQMYQVVEIFELNEALDFTDTLEIKANLASLLNINQQSAIAKDILNEVLAIQTTKLGTSHDSTLYTQKLLAYTLSKLGEHDQAISMINNAAALAADNFETQHPIVVSMLYNQAKIYQGNNQSQLALDKFQEIMVKQLVSPNQALYAKILRGMAFAHTQLDQIKPAIDLYQQCLANRIEMFSQNHLKTLEIRMDLLKLMMANNLFEDAAIQIKAVKSALQQLGLSNHSYWAEINSYESSLNYH